jgi:hypothetical protein
VKKHHLREKIQNKFHRFCENLIHQRPLMKLLSRKEKRHYSKDVPADYHCIYKFIAEKGQYFLGLSETFDKGEVLNVI